MSLLKAFIFEMGTSLYDLFREVFLYFLPICYHIVRHVSHAVVLLMPYVCKVTSISMTFGLWVIMETWEGLDNKDRYFQRTLSWLFVSSLAILCVKELFHKCFQNRRKASSECEGQRIMDRSSEEQESDDDASDFQDCENEN